uniref:uncharacterized protein LOC122609529 n=1 Tax=Erigeron canadensis TaxID=72917 RepID=UPI001CB9187B|nr:uncharacterized protein LOC122609529 [Erigeron canadensis]
MASQDCWIWHAYVGVVGSNNNINVLNQSTLFNYFEDDTASLVPVTVNGTEYKYPYFLVDGIYPRYAMFVKTIPHPTVREPTRQMEELPIRRIMYACCILHNMILKDEDHALCPDYTDPLVAPQPSDARLAEIQDSNVQEDLRMDLIDHINRTFIPGLDC